MTMRYLLLAMVLPFFSGCATFRGDVRTASQGKATKATIHAVCTAIDMFEIDTARYPTREEGLKALVENPGDGQWLGPYIRGGDAPLDAWGTPLRYTTKGTSYMVVSAGADKHFDTQDDVRP